MASVPEEEEEEEIPPPAYDHINNLARQPDESHSPAPPSYASDSSEYKRDTQQDQRIYPTAVAPPGAPSMHSALRPPSYESAAVWGRPSPSTVLTTPGAHAKAASAPPQAQTQTQVTEVTKLLSSLGLSQYSTAFAEQGFERRSDLDDVTHQDLIELGVDKLGHRKRLLRACAPALPPANDWAKYAAMLSGAPKCCGGGVYKLADGSALAESGVLAQPGEVSGLISLNWWSAHDLRYGGLEYLAGHKGPSSVSGFGRTGENGIALRKCGPYLLVAIARHTFAEGPCMDAVNRVAAVMPG